MCHSPDTTQWQVDAEGDGRIQLSSMKPDIENICRNVETFSLLNFIFSFEKYIFFHTHKNS